MHQKHLLRFIKSKLKKEPDEVVIFRWDQGHPTTDPCVSRAAAPLPSCGLGDGHALPA